MSHKPPFLPPALGLLVMLAIFSLHFIKPLALLFPYPWNFLGLIPVVFGAALNLIADRELQRAGASVDFGEVRGPLVERGVYRISRNPMYLGQLMIAAGLAIWVGTLSSWVVLPVFVVALQWLFVRPEEERLYKQHGQAYVAYCQRVRRWL
ncbi:MAG TPA: isoprenylcysteine carboxylmethyltransferase family protein [Saccharospirillum sp.]|nr:isoprenylcysteine carboxylmethyltransferase family protein [Saccharospirillum sp.]